MMFAVPGSPGGYSPPPGADEQEEVEALVFEGSPRLLYTLTLSSFSTTPGYFKKMWEM